jgi:hypothetical protein
VMGLLRPDPSLIPPAPVDPDLLIGNESEAATDSPEDPPGNATAAVAETASYTVQFDTPDVGSVTSTESAVRSVPGVQSVDTTSLALGGISVMKVTFAGDAGALRLALSARGFRVEEGGNVLRIRRARLQPPPVQPENQ